MNGNMDWGMANRLSKTIRPDGRCFYLAMDHGYFQGPTHCLEQPGKAAEPLLPYIDALFVTRGVLRAVTNPAMNPALILRVSGGNSMVGKDLANEEATTAMDDIIRLNASAVGISVYIGSDYEHQTLMALAKLVNECTAYGIPVMAVTAVGRETGKMEARYLSLACRICAEFGASVVKTYYCEGFEKVTGGCPVPVVIAGGPKTDSEYEVLQFVYNGIQQGAIGVNLGRNIWQNECPVGMARSLQALIHENATPQEAYELFLSIKQDVK
ncbi:MAG: 3-hydroxy-5-phosphonooxypentane-2,4-dione thiolase [Chloroflexi bacterium]|nr:3-hydroxy-5-phosphonooxypentane-2,4-dione thiolase [Chloroflexota bacterium]